MATIKPFKGIRPPQDLVEQVASRPYDVLNSAEAREEAAGNEKSLYHIIKPEIDFPVGTDEHDERVYRKAAENFQMFQDKGWLVQDDKENYYIYAQTMNGKTQYGLVVGDDNYFVDSEEYVVEVTYTEMPCLFPGFYHSGRCRWCRCHPRR